MNTNRERIKFLKERLAILSDQVVKRDLESNYMLLLEEISKGKSEIAPITDIEWEVMLPIEREQHFLAYYHTVRTDFLAISQQAEKMSKVGKLQEWLDKPWVQISLTGVALAEFAIALLEMAHTYGLFFEENDQTDFLT